METANLGNELVTSYATTVAKTEEKETTIPGEKTLYVMAQFEGLELTLCDIYRDVMTTDIKSMLHYSSCMDHHSVLLCLYQTWLQRSACTRNTLIYL